MPRPSESKKPKSKADPSAPGGMPTYCMSRQCREHMAWARRLRAMWKEDRAMVVRVHPRLSDEDAAENFGFVLEDWDHGYNDAAELVDRVRRGVKPMATIVLREGKSLVFNELAVVVAAREMGLSCQVVSLRSKAVSRRVAVVFQPLKTLSKYYPPDETIARYQAAGVRLGRELFHTPLETYARGLALEDFQAEIRLPLVGMCFGYPVQETLATLRLGTAWT